jgi:hypothetical protein
MTSLRDGDYTSLIGRSEAARLCWVIRGGMLGEASWDVGGVVVCAEMFRGVFAGEKVLHFESLG